MNKNNARSTAPAALIAIFAMIVDAYGANPLPTQPFVFALRGRPVQSLSPTDAFSTNCMTIEAQILEGLMRFDARKPDQDPQRNLAAWHNIVDPLTYVFRLRTDIYFHPFPGHPKDRVTADDVKFSLERAMNSESPLAQPLRSDIARIETVGNDLVKIKLKQANRDLLSMLATSIGHVTSRKYFESLGPDDETRKRLFNRFPVGTGPYRLMAPLSRTDTVVLTRFDNYRDTSWVKATDSLPSVTFRFFDDPKAILAGISRGEIGMANLPLTEFGDGVNVSPGTGTLTKLTPPFLVILAINTHKKRLDDARIRQLLNAAVQRPQLEKICRSNPADLPPGYQYFMQIPQQQPDDGAEVITRLLSDPTVVAELDALRKTGLTILVPDRTDSMVDQIVETLTSDFHKKLQIPTRIEKGSPTTEVIAQKNPDLIYAHWTPDSSWEQNDASILNPLFLSGSRYNLGGYSDPIVDELFGQIRKINDPTTTAKNYDAIQKRLVETAPLIWLPSVRYMTLFLKKGYDAPYVVRSGGPSSNLVHFTSMVKDIRKVPTH
jgi:peptide/nickel transport system substrate-binding protein